MIADAAAFLSRSERATLHRKAASGIIRRMFMPRLISWILCFAILCLGAAGAQDKKQDKKPEDPLPEKSEWKGKLTQRGKIMGMKELPPEFETVLVVTKRKDAEFECELREKTPDSFVTYLCKGKVTPAEKGPVKVEFESVGVKAANENFVSVPKVPYTGT